MGVGAGYLMKESIVFYVFALSASVTAAIAVTRRDAVSCAKAFTAFLISTFGIIYLLSAPLFAMIWALTSIGLALAAQKVAALFKGTEKAHANSKFSFERVLGVMATFYLAIVLLLAVLKPPFETAPQSGESFESPYAVADCLFGEYIPVILLAALLLVAARIAMSKPVGRGSEE